MSDKLIHSDGCTQLYRVVRYEVFDEWTGSVRGVFDSESDAQFFMKKLKKRNRKLNK